MIVVAVLIRFRLPTATFTPAASLNYDKTYMATVTTGAKDSTGNALETCYMWSFTTGSAQSDASDGSGGAGGCFITTLRKIIE